ncbi:MAG TPA: hypothetical protein VH115_08585 [Solirubrobacteraceae bacterium]|nr:hypothetical protein [Solirubrobacteraceae bacterium]
MLVALGNLPADVLKLAGEPVAQQLELFEAQQARTARRDVRAGARVRRRQRADVRERARDQARALTLELRDLRAQRAASGRLVDLPRGPRAMNNR